MTDVHYQETDVVYLPLEAVTRHLVENLHIRWGYGLLYVDRYTGENDMPVNAVYGLRKNSDDVHFGMRIVLTDNGDSTSVEVHVRHIVMSGWPLQTNQGKGFFNANSSIGHQAEFEKIADDIFRFCENPQEQSPTVIDTLRNLFSIGERRKHKR